VTQWISKSLNYYLVVRKVGQSILHFISHSPIAYPPSASTTVAEKIEILTLYAAELYNVIVRQDHRYMAEKDLIPCGEIRSAFSP